MATVTGREAADEDSEPIDPAAAQLFSAAIIVAAYTGLRTGEQAKAETISRTISRTAENGAQLSATTGTESQRGD